MSLLGDIGDAVGHVWEDVTKTGVPAAIAGAEDSLAKSLHDQAVENRDQAVANASEVMNASPASAGVMDSISESFKSVAEQAYLGRNGLYIILGVVLTVLIVKKVF